MTDSPGIPQRRRLGGLDTVVIPGDPGGMTVVMCHGYGADAWDLVPLAQALRVPPGTTWLFPDAPLEVPLGPHMSGRAWFGIDLAALEEAMARGQHRDLANESPPALERARESVAQMITAAGAAWNRTVLAGFSQGAMVATATALHAHRQPLGLAVLSGTLIDAAHWQTLVPRHKGLPVFQSHGTRDPLLDIQAARRLHRLFLDAEMPCEYIEFSGGHEIGPPVLARLDAWLAAR